MLINILLTEPFSNSNASFPHFNFIKPDLTKIKVVEKDISFNHWVRSSDAELFFTVLTFRSNLHAIGDTRKRWIHHMHCVNFHSKYRWNYHLISGLYSKSVNPLHFWQTIRMGLELPYTLSFGLSELPGNTSHSR